MLGHESYNSEYRRELRPLESLAANYTPRSGLEYGNPWNEQHEPRAGAKVIIGAASIDRACAQRGRKDQCAAQMKAVLHVNILI